MSKIIQTTLTEDDYEDWQYEHSAVVSSDFIEDTIIPLLDDFELNNEDDEYIVGIATYGLFVTMVQRLGQMGYTEKDLKKEIKVFLNSSLGEQVH